VSTESSQDLTRPSRAALQAVVALHVLESIAQAAGLLVVPGWLGITLAADPLWLIVGAFAAWNAGTLVLLRLGRLAVTSAAVLLQLVVDVAVLSGLLYFSGGSTNPFVSLYLVPVALGATILSLPHALALAAACIGAYSVLMRWFIPIPALEMGHVHDGLNLHILGMWANFIVSAVIVLMFLGRLARISRARAELVSRLREQAVRNEQVVAMGSIAAATAHSLSTPLSTVSVILDELAEDLDPAERAENVELARQQIEHCRSHLTGLLAAGGVTRLDAASREPLGEYLDEVLGEWLTTRPDAQLERRLDGSLRGAAAVVDPSLRHCLFNLLNNAADANAERGASLVTCDARLAASTLTVVVEDRGPGPPGDLDAVEFASTKPHGAGVGLLLTRANLGRMGGSLRLDDLRPGCRATLRVPLLDAEAAPA